MKRLEETEVIRKGEWFISTDGLYDEYHILALCQALEDIVVSEELRGYWVKNGNSPMDAACRQAGNKFISWLRDTRKCVKTVEFKELNWDDLDSEMTLSVDDTHWRAIKISEDGNLSIRKPSDKKGQSEPEAI